MGKLTELKEAKGKVIAAGLPVCNFQIERRITDVERNKQCLEACSDKEVHAILVGKLRLGCLMHYNVRGAARKQKCSCKAHKSEGHGRQGSDQKTPLEA